MGVSRSRSIRQAIVLLWTEAGAFVRVRLALVLTLVIVAAGLTPLGPLALKLIVDRFTGHSSIGMFSIWLLVAFYVLSQWLSRAMGEIRGLIYARAERRIFRALSEKLFGHVMRLPLRFHLERQTGALSQTLENGLQGYQMILHHLVFTVLPVVVQLGAISLILLGYRQPVFLLIFLAALVCYGAAFAYFARRVAASAESASGAHIDANATMTDSILNYETVKFFNAEDVVQQRVSKALVATEERWVDFYRRYAFNGLGVATIYAVFLALAFMYAAHEVLEGRMSVGDFVLVNSYMLQVMQPIEMLGYAVQGFSQGAALIRRTLDLFDESPESSAPGFQPSAAGRGQLQFENVSLSYQTNRTILRDVSFILPAGKTLGIVGASGAGKSTIVRLLVRLFDPDGGRILLDGVPTSDLSLSEVRSAVAVVPQDTVLFNDTIGYNIAFGKPGSTREEVEEAARVAHLHDFIMSLPERYETRVGERGVKLSGGEKQRVSIARAALKHPRIYVFDEATSSLDSRTEREILRNLRELSRSSTTLVIAHRLSTIVYADEIVVLEGGTLAERGTHSSLLKLGGRYAGLWRAQQSGAQAETKSGLAELVV